MATTADRIDIVLNLVWKDQQKLAGVLSQLNRITHATNLIGRAARAAFWPVKTLFHQLGRAVGFYVTFRLFSLIYRGINALTQAIPDLIQRGEEWAKVLDDIQDVTGMTAEQTSKLAGVARLVGVSVDGLGRQLSMMARGVIENEENLTKYGIRVRDANGDLRSSWQIFQSVRNAVSAYGKQLLSTSAMQQTFGKSGFQLLDLLQLSQRQFHRLAQEARRAGLWMTQAGIDGAEAWERTKNQLDATITGLGAQILGGVAPVLSALVASIAGAIQKNMDQIVDFVSSVIVWIVGAIAGFFDLDIKIRSITSALIDSTTSLNDAGKAQRILGNATRDTADATEKHTNAIERQIKAIDKQLDKLDRAEDRRRARREHKELLQDISDARKELSDLRNETIFFGGMSAVEAELARQAQAADIIDAEKNLADAKKALRDWEREQEVQDERDRLERLRSNLEDRLAAMSKAAQKAAGSLKRAFQSVPGVVDDVAEKVLKLSDKLKGVFGEGSKQGANFRKLLQDIRDFFEELVNFFQTVLQPILDTISRMFDRVIIPVLKKIGETLGMDFTEEKYTGRKGAYSDLGLLTDDQGRPIKSTRKPFTQRGVDYAVGGVRNIFTDERGREFRRIGEAVAAARARQAPRARTGPYSDLGLIPEVELRRRRAPAGIGGSEAVIPMSRTTGGRATAAVSEAQAKRQFESLFGGAGGGARGGRAAREMELDRTMRRYWGRSSELSKTQREQLGELSAVTGNTDPLVSGEVGTRVNRWDAGQLGTRVDNEVLSRVNNEIGARVNNEVGTRVNNEVGSRITNEVGTRVNNEITGRITNEVASRINNTVGVQNGNFGEIGNVNAWRVGGAIATSVGNRVDTAVQNTPDTRVVNTPETRVTNRPDVSVEGWGIGQIKTKVNAWADGVEATVNVTAFSIQFLRNMVQAIKDVVPWLAAGGPVTARMPVMVGEQGPELFTPESAGTIYSNSETRRMLSRTGYSSPMGVLAGPSNITIQLDPHTTRLLLSGRAVNTSTRAGVGI